MKTNYGVCECGSALMPIWFTEEEYESISYSGGSMSVRTGRKRHAVSHLECPMCGRKECVDDSFDGPWHY